MRAIVSEVPITYGIVAVVKVEMVGLLSFCGVYVSRFTQSMLCLFFLKTLFKNLASLA